MTAGWVKRLGDGQPLVTWKAPSTAMCPAMSAGDCGAERREE